MTGVPWASDAPALEHGRYLFRSRGCADCHGVDGGGREFINDGKAYACAGPISRRAELLATTPHRDWERVVRHGVKSDGRPASIMPSETTTA